MPARHLNLLFYQIEIIEQPFSGRCNPPSLINHQRSVIKCPQNFLIVFESTKQSIRRPVTRDLMLRPEELRMTRELLEVEQLCSQRCLTELLELPARILRTLRHL